MLIEVTSQSAPVGERGSPVVAIPVLPTDGENHGECRALATISSVVQHTAESVPVLLVGADVELSRLADALSARLEGRSLLAYAGEPGSGRGALVNAAARLAYSGDLVLLIPGVTVATRWLERLRAAAISDATVASATPLSLGYGGVDLTLPRAGGGVETRASSAGDMTPESQPTGDSVGSLEGPATVIAEHSKRLLPRIASIGPGCVYLRRRALELVAPVDETLELDAALGSLATSMVAVGYVHVLADDVLVDGAARGLPSPHHLPAPALHSGVEETIAEERGRLARAVSVGRTALRSLSVTVDARALTATLGGTQTYIIELIRALANNGGTSVRALIPPDLSERAREALEATDTELVTYDQVIDGVTLSDVVHRPQQVFTPDDLNLLKLVADRIVIGQQDLISYHNHSYHPNLDRWRSYRRVTRMSLAAADQVVFFSEHARRDARAEDLVNGARAHVVSVGLERHESIAAQERRPDGVAEADPFLLCLGADYAHKNRPFAIKLLRSLRDRGWMGRLVLAGAHVQFGSSRERERELLRSDPDLAATVVDVGPVDEAGRRWLYRRARGLVYPTLYEGFGLLPLEAAAWDLPCLFAAQASLAEFAEHAATLVPWDSDASAAAILPLLSDGGARDAHMGQLRGISLPSWQQVAEQLVEVYERAIAEPASSAAPRVWLDLERESYIARLEHDVDHLRLTAQEYQDAYHALEKRVANGLPLIDEGGLLTAAQQRGLMRVASRRRFGSVLLAPFELLGRRN
jgi:glycosyltransferase involved in cell wall biosynthesis